MKNRVIRNDNIKYLQLSAFGSKLNLSISSYEIVGEKIIGLDAIKRQLLILGITNDINQINIIALDELRSISVKKIYTGIKPGELRKRKVYEFLKSIFLQFDFKDARETIVLPFYENEINDIGDLPDLETKVKNWHVIISKMIGHQNNKPAQENRQLSLVD